MSAALLCVAVLMAARSRSVVGAAVVGALLMLGAVVVDLAGLAGLLLLSVICGYWLAAILSLDGRISAVPVVVMTGALCVWLDPGMAVTAVLTGAALTLPFSLREVWHG